MSEVLDNLGNGPVCQLPQARFPDVGRVLTELGTQARPPWVVDVLLPNPPAPDGAIWIRSQNRVGCRSQENMIWKPFSSWRPSSAARAGADAARAVRVIRRGHS